MTRDYISSSLLFELGKDVSRTLILSCEQHQFTYRPLLPALVFSGGIVERGSKSPRRGHLSHRSGKRTELVQNMRDYASLSPASQYFSPWERVMATILTTVLGFFFRLIDNDLLSIIITAGWIPTRDTWHQGDPWH